MIGASRRCCRPAARKCEQGWSGIRTPTRFSTRAPLTRGSPARTDDIARIVHGHRSDTLLLVDEAWGAHLAFHSALPQSAMAAGADACVQSAHTLGGSLQQTGTILWREDRLDSELMERAFADYATTSPSFQLLASIDAALRHIALEGREALDAVMARAEDLRRRLDDALPQVELFEDQSRLRRLAPRIAGHDNTKVTLGLSRFASSGYELRDRLFDDGIVVEKAGLGTLALGTLRVLDASPRYAVGL